jgi:serine/threonine protein kinase
MKAERWRQIEALFHAARELRLGERAEFLVKACAGDEELRREIDSLLSEDDRGGSVLAGVASDLAAEWVQEQELLTIGQALGHFRIHSQLGKGGMGEVYRARDTRLKRDVAIKILPEEFSRDRNRVARFQREAEVLASLNHPNIAAIYDLEEAEGSRFLVLEFVEGETLAERIGRGPIPVEEALNIARNICEALEAAHEKGITHRDLKPANIKITPDGKVKVLDFGLAKAIEKASTGTAQSNSPTLLSTAETSVGVILGTAAYMSPEQARGQQVDRRTDMFAFGALLYEMLTAHRAFDGEDIASILSSVLQHEPDWTLLPPNLPPRIRDLLRLCLQKDRRRRRSGAADARIDIEEAQAVPTIAAETNQETAIGSHRRERAWAFAVVIVTAALAGISIHDFNRPEPQAPPEIRLEVSTPSAADPLSFAISPDGRRMVFSASNEGKSQLWVRPLESVTAQPLAGTDGASYPFWSPDSASVGFFAGGKLKRIGIVGGAPQEIANTGVGRGGAWNREGTILFNPIAGPLFKVSATGGEEPVAVTRLETGQGSHRFPQFLPDGRHFIYFVQAGPAQGIYAGSLDGGLSKRLASADAAAVVSPSGFLLFLRQTTLFAQAFDFKRQELSGNPFRVAEQLAFDAGTAAPGFSATSGIVAYRTGSAGVRRQLTWLDRSGKSVGTIGAPDEAGLNNVELSPDGKRVAVNRAVTGNRDIWLIDAARGVPTPFTFDAASDGLPVWSADGSHVVFTSNRRGVFNLYWKVSSGAGADELLLESDQAIAPTDWSADGRFLLFRSLDPQTGMDLWVLPVSADKKDKKPFPFLKTARDEYDGQFSPNGKWIAYESNESGRFEIYVQPFPGPGGKFQISSNGGVQPRWNKNGKEIFYVSLDSKMMAAPVKLSPHGQSLETVTPAALFPVRIAGGLLPFAANKQQYAVSSDGQRFLVNLAVDEGVASPITLILNWHPERGK